MITPRILMYAGGAALAWTFLRRYLAKKKLQDSQPKIVEDSVVPGVDRRGDDAFCVYAITAADAAAGKAVAVPSIDGPQQIQIPAGIKDGTRLRLAGLGFKKPAGSRGDQFVVVKIAQP